MQFVLSLDPAGHTELVKHTSDHIHAYTPHVSDAIWVGTASVHRPRCLKPQLHCCICSLAWCWLISSKLKLCAVPCRAISRDIYRGERPAAVQYLLALKTSDMRGAGTSANVHLTMHGHQASGATHTLTASPHDFDRYAIRTYPYS